MEDQNLDNTTETNIAERKVDKKIVITLVVLLVLVVMGGVGSWFWQQRIINSQKASSQKQIDDLGAELKAVQAEQANDTKKDQVLAEVDQKAITDQVQAIYKYWIDNKDKDINYLLKNNLITPALVEQYNSGLSYDLISCSQNTLDKSSDYTFSLPTITSPTSASMQISGEYPGAGTPSTLIINLDMTKDSQVWKLNKVSCPKS